MARYVGKKGGGSMTTKNTTRGLIPEEKLKAVALHNLEKALFVADIGVKDLRLVNPDTVQIAYNNKHSRTVNIEGDSIFAMLFDVLNAVRVHA
jgi:hypothetical protein